MAGRRRIIQAVNRQTPVLSRSELADEGTTAQEYPVTRDAQVEETPAPTPTEPVGVPISALPGANTPTGNDVVPGVQSDTTKKFSLSALLAWIKGQTSPADIGAVPDTRTVNGKALSQNITLTAADVWAQPSINVSGILKGNGSGGVSAAAAGTDYQAPLTIDASPTASSTNPVQSGGVYTALETKQSKLSGTAGQYTGYDANGDAAAITPDIVPTASSGKLITSGGVDTALVPLDDLTDDGVARSSGAVVTFDSEFEAPLKECIVNIDPVQNLHGYDHPWAAGKWKNLAPINSRTKIGWANTSDILNNQLNTLPAGTYNFSFDVTVTSVEKTGSWQYGFYFKHSDREDITKKVTVSSSPTVGYTGSVTKSFTLTAAQVGRFTNVYLYGCGSNSQAKMGESTLSHIQLEQGNSRTSYAPYSNICPISGRTQVNVYVEPEYVSADPQVTIDFGSTVYGGTLNVTTGVLTIDRANIASYNEETLPGKWISSLDAYAEGTTPTTGAQVVYELATPQTIQLTPTEVLTLLGMNNVWADTGDISIKTGGIISDLYRAKLSKSVIAPELAGMTAESALSENDFVIVDNQLYIITSAIANGGTLTPGTNCQATTIAAQIANILNS